MNVKVVFVALVALGLFSAGGEAQQTYIPPATSAEGLYRAGSRLQKDGKPEDALAAWRALIDRFPNSNRAGCAAIYMGQQQLANKDYSGAEKSFSLAAASKEGVSLRSLVAERYEKMLGEKGFKINGLHD